MHSGGLTHASREGGKQQEPGTQPMEPSHNRTTQHSIVNVANKLAKNLLRI